MEKIDYRCTVTSTVELRTLVTVPANFDPAGESLPLIVFLHGIGERADLSAEFMNASDAEADFKRLAIHGVPKLFSRDPEYKGLRVITVSPQCPGDKFWSELPDAIHCLTLDMAKKYNADPCRIYLTGLSMGGFGTWATAVKYPETYAAIAPICGRGDVNKAAALKNMPIWAVHGDADNAVDVKGTIEMTDAVRAAGGEPKVTILPGVGHNSWDWAYETSDLLVWLTEHKKA